MTHESRAARRRLERATVDAERKEAKAALAPREAKRNFARLASPQIHDLHVLLQDEAWPGRVTRVSARNARLGAERRLTAFPTQSLADARAMAAFSRFPASLTTGAEVSANLEAAVRAAPVAQRTLHHRPLNPLPSSPPQPTGPKRTRTKRHKSGRRERGLEAFSLTKDDPTAPRYGDADGTL